MNELKRFQNQEFGEVRMIVIDDEPWFVGKDVAESLGYKETANMRKILDEVDFKEINPQSLEFTRFVLNGRILEPNINIKRMLIVNESGLYQAIFGSTLENAKKFKRWVTREVLPSIRKTGGYVADIEQFIDTYFESVDDNVKNALRKALKAIKRQSEAIEEQRKEIQEKEDIIIGLTDDIDLEKRRAIINRLIRYGNGDCKQRWGVLYRHFEYKYHVNLQKRLEAYNKENTPKLRSKLDYIDKVMGKINEL